MTERDTEGESGLYLELAIAIEETQNGDASSLEIHLASAQRISEDYGLPDIEGENERLSIEDEIERLRREPSEICVRNYSRIYDRAKLDIDRAARYGTPKEKLKEWVREDSESSLAEARDYAKRFHLGTTTMEEKVRAAIEIMYNLL